MLYFFFVVKTKHRIKEGMQMEPRAICSSTGDFREADSGRCSYIADSGR